MTRRDYTYGSAGDCTITFDLLPPADRIIAPPGSMHLDLDSATIYLKQTGVEATGWAAVAGGGGGSLPDGDYGDVTISGDGTLITINDEVITLDKLQDIPSGYVLGRTSPGTGDVELVPIAGLGGGGSFSALTPYDLYINSFYPTTLVASVDVANGASHPLSEFYATLVDAQVDFPLATDLTDEIDWCAWQTAIEYAYVNFTDAFWDALDLNMATVTFHASGTYMVNKPIQVYLASCTIRGSGQAPFDHGGNHQVGGTSVRYNGPTGTVDAPVFMFDANGIYAWTTPNPSGKDPVPAGGMIFRMYDMSLYGNEYVDWTLSPTLCGANFVVGIFLRNTSFSEVARCTIGGGLYDGIWACSQLFLNIRNNFFYGCYRDSIAIQAFLGDFSTTVWIDDNEFGLNGRYAIMQNYDGAVEPAPSVRRNSIESAYPASWYWSQPDHWVQGAVGVSLVQINGTFGMYSENRYEGNPADPIWGTTMFINCSNLRLLANRWGAVIFSGFAGDRYTTDYPTFRAANDCVDITDTRNFNAPSIADPAAGCMSIFVDSHQGGIAQADGGGLSSSLAFNFTDSFITIITVPTVDGTYGRLFGEVGVVSPVAATIGNYVAQNTYLQFGPRGPCYIAHGDGSASGTMTTLGTGSVATWAASTAYDATGVGGTDLKWLQPATYNGYWYEVTVSGTSDVAEPTWPTGIGDTVVDGTVTWKNIGYLSKPSITYVDRFEAGRRHVTRSFTDPYPATAADGMFFAGDRSYSNLPDSPTNVSWTCIATGIPGTWVADGGAGGVAGADTEVQFNDSGALAGDAGLTFNKTSNKLTIGGNIDWGGGHSIYDDANATVITDHGAATSLVSRYDFTFIPQAAAFGWGDGSFNQDLNLWRDAAYILAQRCYPDAPQTFRIYNVSTGYEPGADYERGKLEWASNVFKIGTEKAGTGTARALALQTDGTNRITIGATTGIADFSVMPTVGGALIGSPVVYNSAVAAQGPGFAADTYVTNSNVATAGRLKAGSRYAFRMQVTKTGAGVVAPIFQIRMGTTGTISDASILTLTQPVAQTAAIDEGIYEIEIVFRTVGSGTSAVVNGLAIVTHSSNTAGFATTATKVWTATSAGFDSTGSTKQIGVSFNGGTSMSATVNSASAELRNLS